MGVTCELSSANPAHVKLLKADPRLVDAFLSGEEGDETEGSSTWLQRLLRRKPSVPPEIRAVEDSMRISLDKSWHGLHFLLTGTADEAPLPAGLLLSGGTPLAGASHLLDPSEVRQCHEYLSDLSDEELADSYSPERMDELDIYPGIWSRDGAEALDDLLASLEMLRTLLRDCVDEGHGLVITIE